MTTELVASDATIDVEMNIILVRKRKQALHNIQFAINSGIRESK